MWPHCKLCASHGQNGALVCKWGGVVAERPMLCDLTFQGKQLAAAAELGELPLAAIRHISGTSTSKGSFDAPTSALRVFVQSSRVAAKNALTRSQDLRSPCTLPNPGVFQHHLSLFSAEYYRACLLYVHITQWCVVLNETNAWCVRARGLCWRKAWP